MDRSPKGQCYTLQYQKPLQTTDTIIFGLFPEASSYVVVLHDPKFFLKTETPLIFPRILNEYKVRVSEMITLNACFFYVVLFLE